MSYSDVLCAVARLHVDVPFREAFLADPAAALRDLALTGDERDALLRIDRETVTLLGRLADHHRWMRIADHLPWLDASLRPDLLDLVGRYLGGAPPQLLCRDEALAFCRFLIEGSAVEPGYLREIARHEVLRISIAWGLPCEASEVADVPFDVPVLDVLEKLGQPGWPSVEPRPCRLTFKKVPGIPAVLVRQAPL